MERRVNVNEIVTPVITPDGLPQGWWPNLEPSEQDTEGARVGETRVAALGFDHAPCLYFGPNGQRCSKRALATGFCASHRPGPGKAKAGSVRPARLLTAAAAIIGILWPYLDFLVREIIRWAHSR